MSQFCKPNCSLSLKRHKGKKHWSHSSHLRRKWLVFTVTHTWAGDETLSGRRALWVVFIFSWQSKRSITIALYFNSSLSVTLLRWINWQKVWDIVENVKLNGWNTAMQTILNFYPDPKENIPCFSVFILLIFGNLCHRWKKKIIIITKITLWLSPNLKRLSPEASVTKKNYFSSVLN